MSISEQVAHAQKNAKTSEERIRAIMGIIRDATNKLPEKTTN